MPKMYIHQNNILGPGRSRNLIKAGTPFEAEKRFPPALIEEYLQNGTLTLVEPPKEVPKVESKKTSKTDTKRSEAAKKAAATRAANKAAKEKADKANVAILFCLPPEVLDKLSLPDLDAKHAEICAASGLEAPAPFASRKVGIAKLSSQYKAE